MSTPGLAVPGSVVASGAAVSPGGAQGIQGVQGPAGSGGGSGGSGTKTWRKFSASDANPPATAYALWQTRNSTPILAFNDSTQWSSFFVDVVPEGAVLTSGVLVRIAFVPASASSGVCIFGVQIERMNTSVDADSFDTAGTVSTTVTSSTVPVVASVTLTTIDGISVGDTYRLKVYRDASNASDTMVGDAQILSVEIRSAN